MEGNTVFIIDELRNKKAEFRYDAFRKTIFENNASEDYKMKQKYIIIIHYIFFISMLTLLGCTMSDQPLNNCTKNLKKENAVKIASKYANELGYDIKSMEIKVLKYNQPYNKFLPKENKGLYATERRKKLEGKIYFAVKYNEKEPYYKGGGICVFINANNGKILATCRGK